MKKTPLHSLKMQLRLLASALFLSFCAPLSHSADIFGPASTVDYQGRLLDSNGNALAPDAPTNYQVQFRLYDEQTGGTVVWAESQLVTVSKGQFSVRLGEGTAILGGGGADVGAVDHDAVGLPGAFGGKDRFLGLTVIIPGQQSGEIQPRLAFLTSPFSFVAGRAQSADAVNQSASSAPSSLNVGAVSYTNAVMSATGTITLTAQTILVDSAAAVVTATLPAGTAALNRQYLVTKKDNTTNQVVVSVPSGGSLNGTLNGTVRLKVRGESVSIQNVGGNDWWVVADTRDKTPAGTIIAFGGGTIPAGYRLCDGSSILRADFPDLYSATGNAWGTANATSFNLPDMRGRFPRGVDGGTGRDDEAASRTLAAAGGNTGNNVGTVQTEQFRFHGHGVSDPGHNHGLNDPGHSHAAAAGAVGYRLVPAGTNSYYCFSPFVQDGATTSNVNPPTIFGATTGISIIGATTNISIAGNGGGETRPDNAAVFYLIKY